MKSEMIKKNCISFWNGVYEPKKYFHNIEIGSGKICTHEWEVSCHLFGYFIEYHCKECHKTIKNNYGCLGW